MLQNLFINSLGINNEVFCHKHLLHRGKPVYVSARDFKLRLNRYLVDKCISFLLNVVGIKLDQVHRNF